MAGIRDQGLGFGKQKSDHLNLLPKYTATRGSIDDQNNCSGR